MAAHHPDVHRLHLQLPSDPRELERLVEALDAFLTRHVSDEELVYRVTLLATEAVTNAMEHGHDYDANKKVKFDLDVQDDRIDMYVEDEGEGFRPEAVQDPLADANLLKEGGRGVFLIEQMADSYAYEDGGRRLHLTFRRDA